MRKASLLTHGQPAGVFQVRAACRKMEGHPQGAATSGASGGNRKSVERTVPVTTVQPDSQSSWMRKLALRILCTALAPHRTFGCVAPFPLAHRQVRDMKKRPLGAASWAAPLGADHGIGARSDRKAGIKTTCPGVVFAGASFE